MCVDFPVQTVAFDRWRIDVLQKELARIGAYHVPLAPFGQGFKDMAPAVDAIEEIVFAHRLRHGAHPLLRWCVANTQAIKDPAGNRKLDKAKSYGRIDPAVALVMAVGAMSRTKVGFDGNAMIG
jgi:phage terminase large subunit-like protein